MFRKSALLAAVLFVSWASSAAQAVNLVKTINIRQNTATTWHLAEVEGIQFVTGVNLASQANGGVASATGTGAGFGSILGDGNDGNRIGNFGVGSVWHDDGDNVAGEIYTITLLNPSNLSAVNVFGRTDCCQTRDDNLTLELRDAGGVLLHSVNFGIPNIADTSSTTAINGITLNLPVVPEPATASLAIMGAFGLIARRRRLA